MPCSSHQRQGLGRASILLGVALRLSCRSAVLAQHDSHGPDRATCELATSSGQLVGSNLLQVRTGLPMQTGPHGMREGINTMRSHAILTLPDASESSGVARNILPPHLLDLGRELLGSEKVLDELVANSRLENITYAGVSVLTRMLQGDMSNGSMVANGGHQYGLETLRKASPTGMLHMLDLGGNYGLVSIAAFKKYPEALQAVVVEPVPTTYFFLRWNMWLNQVPELKEMVANTSIPGIMALQRGVTVSDGEVVEFCYLPPYTTNAFACDCKRGAQNSPELCKAVVGISTRSLLGLFGLEPIALMKVNCEGCEDHSLPAMINVTKDTPDRIKRLVGELHAPTQEVEDIACQHDSGKHFVKTCLTATGKYESAPLRCGANRTSCHNEMPFLEQLRLFRRSLPGTRK